MIKTSSFLTLFSSKTAVPKYILNRLKIRLFSNKCDKRTIILGIETSCDDTGCAVVDNHGTIMSNVLRSQHLIHLRNGGIIPPIAQDLHRANIEPAVEQAITEAGITGADLDAIAVTVKPGLQLSLAIGLKYAKHLARKFSKPIIGIHHMEAHALMARMEHTIEFPFLVLLISGGHCLLSLVVDVDDFKLLGKSIDDSPGETFDKISRRMKLRNVDKFSKLSGGQAIEIAASLSENPNAFEFVNTMMHYRDCNFSFTGIKNKALKYIINMEKSHGIEGDGVIPEAYDLCASIQLCITRHLCHRTQRAMEYVISKNLLPESNRTLVVSGGVACNDFIAKGLELVCQEFAFKLVRPRPTLCTDNGIMIAWNGIERYQKNIDILEDFTSLDIQNRCDLGEDIIDDVRAANLKCSWVKLNGLI